MEIFEVSLTNAKEWDSAMEHELFLDNTSIRVNRDNLDADLIDYEDLTVDRMIKNYKNYEWNILKAPEN